MEESDTRLSVPVRSSDMWELSDQSDHLEQHSSLPDRHVQLPHTFTECSCLECSRQYFQGLYKQTEPVTPLTDSNAAKLLQTYKESALADKAWLEKQIDERGTTLVNILAKRKNLQQWKQLFREFFPQHHQGGWSMLGCLLDSKDQEWQEHEDSEKFGLMFYLSVNDLAEDRLRFLSLLQARISYGLDEWAMFAYQESKTFCQIHQWRSKLNRHCVVMHGSDFGKLVPCDADRAHRRDIMGYPAAETVLYVQKEIFKFLRAIVTKLVAGRSSLSGRQKWDERVQSNFQERRNLEALSEVRTRPFSRPLELDIDHLVAISKSKAEEAEDVLWLMQTDPYYFQNEIRSWCTSEAARWLGKDVSYGFAHRTIPTGPMVRALIWGWLYEECIHVQEVQRQYCGQMTEGRALPGAFNTALSSLRDLAGQAWKYFAQERNLMPASYQFEGSFDTSPLSQHEYSGAVERHSGQFLMGDEVKGMALQGRQTSSPRDTSFDDRLLWCSLWVSDEEVQNNKYGWLYGYMDDWGNRSNKRSEKPRLETYILLHISDLATAFDILNCVSNGRPNASFVPREAMIKCNSARHAWRTWLVDKDRSPIIHNDNLVGLIKEIGELKLPRGKKNQLYLDRFNVAHDTMARFWEEARAHQRRFLSYKRFSADDKERWIEKYSMCLRKDHLDGVRRERESIEAALQRAFDNVSNGKCLKSGYNGSLNLLQEEARTVSDLASPKPRSRPVGLPRRVMRSRKKLSSHSSQLNPSLSQRM